MKICPACGRELPDTAMFCGSCGENLSAAAAAPQPAQPQMVQPGYGYQAPNPAQSVYGYQDPNAAAQPGYDPAMMQTVYAYQDPNAPQAAAPVYVQPVVYAQPVAQLSTTRGVLKLFLLSLITFGIYSLIFYSGISTDINTIAQRYDGKKTMHFCLLFFLIGPITFGIAYFVWIHKLSARIGSELQRRNLPYSFGAGDFWILGFLLSFTIVCPIIYMHKLCTAMNQLSASYNQIG